MAHFNHNQPRDSRGRFSKPTEQATEGRSAKRYALHGTAPEDARCRYIAAIRDEIKRVADWIEPEEVGNFPRAIITQIRQMLLMYEVAVTGAEIARKL